MEQLRAFWRSGMLRTVLVVLLLLSLIPLLLLGGLSLWGNTRVTQGVTTLEDGGLDTKALSTLHDLERSVSRLNWVSLGVLVLALGGIAVAGVFLSRYLARPLLLLGDVARKVSVGDYSQDVTRLIGPRRDEIGEFAEAFNLMVAMIEAREVNLRAQVQRLKIEIDEARKQQQVSEITESDYFRELRESAQRMREQAGERAAGRDSSESQDES
jgi:methyl-accepting chemotaxis protein